MPLLKKELMAQRVIERRDMLLKEEAWYDSTERLEHYWTEGRVFGGRFKGSRIYPACQFEREDAEPYPVVAELLSILWDRANRLQAAWAEIFWLFQPALTLDERRPADLLGTDPAAVLDAARAAWCRDDGSW